MATNKALIRRLPRGTIIPRSAGWSDNPFILAMRQVCTVNPANGDGYTVVCLYFVAAAAWRRASCS